MCTEQVLKLDEHELPSIMRTDGKPRSRLTPSRSEESTSSGGGKASDSTSKRSQKMTRMKQLDPTLLPTGKTIDGENWPPIFERKNVRSAKSMQPRPSDIFVCTYPKCGTTWIQHIVHQLLGKDAYDKGDGAAAMCFVSPMIERMGAEYCDSVMQPRVLKTHFTYENIPKGNGARYIYAVRNPKDCLTSYFHHHRNFKIYEWENGSFEVFFELFMSGQLGFGDYFTHLRSWLDALTLKEENILFLKYEDMLEDLRGSVLAIGQFLGGAALDAVNDPRRLDEIVYNSTIDAMKEDQTRWFPSEQLHHQQFIRKGGSRDWKNHFTEEQSRRMDERWANKARGTPAADEDWWRDEMQWEDECFIETASGFSSQSSEQPRSSPIRIHRRSEFCSSVDSGLPASASCSSITCPRTMSPLLPQKQRSSSFSEPWNRSTEFSEELQLSDVE